MAIKYLNALAIKGNGGTVLDVQGSQGQLFSVTDSLTGDIFAVSDISGVPILKVNSSGLSTFDGLVSGITPVNAANFVTKAYADGLTPGAGVFLPLTGGTMSGAINAAGGLYFVGDSNMGFVPYPIGAQFRSDSSALTGYIKIELPTDIGITPDDMVSFHVDVYDYTTNETISVFIGGYTYTSTSTTAAYWYNPTAIITTKHTGKDFNVRYGYDGTHFYVAIGETNSVWSHPSIVVRDVQCSYRSNVEHYIDGWDVSVTTTTLTGVDETQTGNLPVAGSVAWGDITSRPYIVNASNNSATATTTIANVAHATYTAAFFDFVIKNGTNVRAGTVYACHNGASTPLIEFAETSTVDLGDTSDVTLAVDISGANMRLRATTTSSTWTIKSLIRAI